MLDDRTIRHSPKAEVLKVHSDAKCLFFSEIGSYIVEIGEGERGIGFGRSAWAAWMDAELRVCPVEQEELN